jgi:parallel beta-helix repeat protein
MKVMIATSCVLTCVLFLVPAAHAKTLLVCPTCVYTTIQSAVDATNPGDVVSVQSGTYYENVVIGTPNVTLKGQKPMGSVLLDCPSSGTGFGVTVLSTGDTVKGLEIEGCEIGVLATLNPEIEVDSVLRSLRASKSLRPGSHGTAVMPRGKADKKGDQNTVITDNTFEENLIGVALVETGDCVVSGNDFFANLEAGIYTEYTFTDTISGNTVEGVSDDDYGIGIAFGNQEAVKNNLVQLAGYAGIVEEYTVSSKFSYNRTTNNPGDGLWAQVPSASNTFSKNTSDSNGYWDCEDDTVGAGTAGTDNKWTGNHGDTSQPPGLCK